MDARKFFEDLALDMSWHFVPARRDYQNLHDVENWIASETEKYGEGETTLFLDPIQRSPVSTEIRYVGNFMILTNSDIDKSYDDKFKDYIEPLIDVVHKTIFNRLRCDWKVTNLTSIEVINQFDLNADGLSVSFTIEST